MSLKDINIKDLVQLMSVQVEHATCIECCEFYVVPTTATCGHTLCDMCWRGRRYCPCCSSQVEKRNLKLNLPLQSLTGHIKGMKYAVEDIFNIRLEEYLLEALDKKFEDPNKYVKDWLTSSQNIFSAPITESQQSSQGRSQFVERVTTTIQIHSENITNEVVPSEVIPTEVIPTEVVYVPPLQVDWDKIDELPDLDNSKENPIGPMDIEPFDIVDEDKEYSNENPRRSSRQKLNNNSNIPLCDVSDKNSKNSNLDSEKSSKLGKNWNNVKRMKKEFSKLNKKNRNKLNVSIEMCKRAQTVNKAVLPSSPHVLYDIDDNTPVIERIDKPVDIDMEILTEKENVYEQIKKNNEEHFNIPSNINRKESASNTKQAIQAVTNALSSTGASKSFQNNDVPQKISFLKKSALIKPKINNENKNKKTNLPLQAKINTDPSEDIEITLKIGTILAHICIKKKENDIQFKINSDREIQIDNLTCNKKDVSCSPVIFNDIKNNNDIKVPYKSTPEGQGTAEISGKSSLIKKNTASVDTATAQFEITESVEQQLGDIIDNVPLTSRCNNTQESKSSSNKNTVKSSSQTVKNLLNIPEDHNDLNDLDIFDSESVKEANVQPLKGSKNPSTILMPTVKTNKSQRDKRKISEANNIPEAKKIKLTNNSINCSVDESRNQAIGEHDSEHINYDAIMSQVFANIDADMGSTKKIMKKTQNTQNSSHHNKKTQKTDFVTTQDVNKSINKGSNEKCSENIFSMLEKDSEILEISKSKTPARGQSQKKDSLVEKPHENERCTQISDIEMVELSTPKEDNDSDKSIVEETPQKTASFSKNRKKNDQSISKTQISKPNNIPVGMLKELQKNKISDVPNTIINLSDSLEESIKSSKNVTVVNRATMETPVTITKFVDQIKHKSTPVARKSLKFNSQMDPEQTLCNTLLAETTQEKEFMRKAFDETQIQSTFKNRRAKFCLAGSCLSGSEQANLKFLCTQRGWTYVDKYTKDLTHLVVGVDEEKKSQRSVKYMCALAGSKWIVSYEWVEKCLKTKEVVDEEPYEALDGSGEPGPKRSRIAKQKLFKGITFYCLPPFSVLDIDTLKEILESAGGRVVDEARGVRASNEPAILLAEPEHTQDNQFTYLAVDLRIVPLNYEWVLNCLGGYTLNSIYELLLCPPSLVSPFISNWPSELITPDDE